MKSHLLIVNLSVGAIGVLFKKLSLVPMFSGLFLTFSSLRLNVSVQIFDLLGLGFLQGDRHGSICILLHADI